jgi:hypothetical protein
MYGGGDTVCTSSPKECSTDFHSRGGLAVWRVARPKASHARRKKQDHNISQKSQITLLLHQINRTVASFAMAENSMPPNALSTTSYSGRVLMVSAFFRLKNRHLRRTPDSETRDNSEDDKSTMTIDHGRIPVIRQPSPLTVETGWPSCCGYPTIVYISNPPMGHRPSRLQFADRVSSIDSTITMSGDEASQDSNDDEDSNDEDLLMSSSIQYVAPPVAPRNFSTGPTRPLPLSFRGSTYGSAISCL